MRRILTSALVLTLAACASTNEASRSTTASPTNAAEIGSEVAGRSPTDRARPSDGSVPGRSGSGAPSSGSSHAREAAGVPSAPLPAGTNRKPIEVGILYTVNDAAEDFGADNGETISPSEVARAMVRSFNESGGLAGRRIVPVYGDLNSASHDYEAQMQANCAAFTEDHKVAVVLSTLGYYSETLLTCLARAKVPLIGGDWGAPDKQDAARFPLYVTPDTLLGETRMAAVVTHLKASKWLQTRHRLGIVIEDCPIDRRVYGNGLAPALRRAGLTVASTFYTTCFRAIQDFAEQASQMSNAVLRFRQAGVDRVMFVSQAAEANLVFLFSAVAQEQRWFPGYAVSSVAAPSALALNMSEEQLVNVRGMGWLPAVDTQNLSQSPPTSTARACLERMKQVGIKPASNTDHFFISAPCDTFTLSDRLLRETKGDASPDALMRALAALGTSFVSASAVEGRTTTSGGRLRPAAGRLFAYTEERGFHYTTAPFAL